MERVDVLVLGGGVAGAALACHLGRLGGGRFALLERHPRPGVHASGRNARLVLQSVAEPTIRGLVAASARAYAQRAAEVGFTASGSLLLGQPATLEGCREPGLVPSRLVDPGAVRECLPLLAGHDFAAALETPGDGVLDPHRLLEWYLGEARRGGVRVELGAEAVAVEPGRPVRVRTPAGDWEAARVVDATGAWAGRLLPGGGAAALVARKRHLFLLDLPLDPALPFVWDLDHDFYFRPDAEGTLACMCDERTAASLEETVDPDAEPRLREVLAPAAPALAGAPLLRAWACFRTRVADGLPLLGPDPAVPGCWWLAGLGGHGLSSSWEVGRLVAEALLEGEHRLPRELRPDRLAASAGAAS